MKKSQIIIEKVMSRLLEVNKEQEEMPSQEVLDDLHMREMELEESDDFKRSEWTPTLEEKVRIRLTDGNEVDIDNRELPEGKIGKVTHSLVAYKVEFGDDEVRWVSKTMIEPT